MSDEDYKDLIADAISDSLEPDWNAHSCASHIMLWLEEAGLRIVPKFFDAGSYFHVVPFKDSREHDSSPLCWCNPRPMDDAPGVLVHVPADGRVFSPVRRMVQ